MPAPPCDHCHRPSASTTTGDRHLCTDCLRQFGMQAGAATALASGQGPAQAVATGIATGAYIGAVEADRQYQRTLQAKIKTTPSFWRRLWLRIVG